MSGSPDTILHTVVSSRLADVNIFIEHISSSSISKLSPDNHAFLQRRQSDPACGIGTDLDVLITHRKRVYNAQEKWLPHYEMPTENRRRIAWLLGKEICKLLIVIRDVVTVNRLTMRDWPRHPIHVPAVVVLQSLLNIPTSGQ